MHNTAQPALGLEQPWRSWVAPGLTAAALALIVIAPRSNVLALALLIGAAIAAIADPSRLQRLGQFSAPAAAALALGAWALVAVAWSVEKGEAATKALTLLALVAAVQAGVNAAHAADDACRRAMSRAAVAVTLASVVFLLIEVLFGQPIHRWVFLLLPMLRPDPKHLSLAADGTILGINPYVLNRHLGAFVLTLCPVLAMVARGLSGPARMGAIALMTLGSAVAALKSEHETSVLALAVALVAFAGMRLAPKPMRVLIVAAWVTATLLVVPIATVAYSAGLHTASWIPSTGRNRIILWAVTAKEIAKTPVRGIGPASTKELDAKAGPAAPRPEDHSYALRTGRHAHNIYMQTWYELGAVGAALLLAFGLLGLRALSRLPAAVEPYAMASFVAAAVIGAFSWGMWQAWFTAAFGLWVVLLAIAAASTDGERSGERAP